ncbi:MAG: hypothetical protein ACI9PY_000968 [Ascidiaceihabitans sp.]|jgi:hypothetical protein
MARGWHIQKDQGQVTLSRQLPARFDVQAATTLPHANMVRLVSQIRQDLWRALQNLRGFSPVVQITKGPDDLTVQAGGRMLGPISAKTIEQIEAVLENPKNRARWLRCSQDRKRP